ncbi:hypothetical protein JCM16303_004525 [Sporobolomyces ruberrimus]
MSDPFAATPHNTIPPGGYDTDILSGAQGRSGSAPGTETTTTPAARPPTLTAGSYRTGTSGGGKKTPWYLQTVWIVVIVLLLLIALGLGVGLGVGLGTKDNTANSGRNEAAQQAGQSTVTSYSTFSSIVTASASTTTVPTLLPNTRSQSIVIETIGGSTVTAIQSGSQGDNSGVLVTVSETLPPTTRTNIVYITTYPSTQTITTTLAGGIAETAFETVTIRRTVTALATARP